MSHVFANNAEAKFEITTGKLIAVYGFSGRACRLLSKVVEENQDLLLEAWRNYEGQE